MHRAKRRCTQFLVHSKTACGNGRLFTSAAAARLRWIRSERIERLDAQALKAEQDDYQENSRRSWKNGRGRGEWLILGTRWAITATEQTGRS